MTDPIETLAALPPETPPREAVLASLRLFRYRALTTILLVAVTVLGLALFGQSAQQPRFDGEIAEVLEHDQVEFAPAAGSAQIGPVRVTVTEVATAPVGNAARMVLEQTEGTDREISLDIVAVRQGTAKSEPILSIQSVGRDQGRRSTAVWVPLDPVMDPVGAAIEWFVLPIPDSILDEGGELTSDDGLTGVVTIERTTTS